MTDDELIYIDESGNRYATGNRPSPPTFRASMPAYSDVYGDSMLTEADVKKWLDSVGGQWLDEPSCIKIKDQNGYGACDGHSAATSIEGARYVAGMTPVDISAWDIYARMCGGIDRGASIGETLPEVMKNGAAPESLVPYGLINPNRIPAAAVAARPQYRVELGASIMTYEELITAYARQQPLNIAVAASGSFTSLDPEGIPMSFRGGGSCNHAQAAMLGLKWSNYFNCLCGRVWNSWTVKVQDGGRYWAPLKVVPQFRWFEAYNVRAVVDSISDLTRPPILLA